MKTMIKNLILDTDLGSDVDDVGAVALANIFHNHHLINLLCITHTTSDKYGPLIVEAINNYYNNSNLEVGVYNGPLFKDELIKNSYNEPTVNAFYHKHNSKEEMVDSIKLLRQKIANNKDITLVFIGQLVNLYYLMTSNGDEFSCLSGLELINQNVKEIYIMGGSFPEITEIKSDLINGEYNLLTALKESTYCLNNLKVKTTMIDYTLGKDINVGAKLVNKYHDKNIVSYAYQRYIYKNQDCSRSSWDLIAIYRACVEDDLFNEVGPGNIDIDEKGITKFQLSKKGNFYILKANKSFKEIEDKIEGWLLEEKEDE